jgi:diacylglycerol kinase (ATP)
MKKNKTFIIANPSSSKGKIKENWERYKNKFKKFDNICEQIEFEFTDEYDGATLLVRKAIKDGFDHIITIGGDGTINETINGFFKEDEPFELLNSDVILSIVNLGTGGDFSKSLKFVKNLDEQIENCFTGEITLLDLGKLTYTDNKGRSKERIFNNITSFGIGGMVDQFIDENKWVKKLGGKIGYAISTISTLAKYKDKDVELVLDGKRKYDFLIKNVAICNGRYFGGGMQIAPEAEVNDGLFDIIVLDSISTPELILKTNSIYKGNHIEDSNILSYRAKKVEAKSDQDVFLDVDGEALGKLPATFEVMPSVIKVRH